MKYYFFLTMALEDGFGLKEVSLSYNTYSGSKRGSVVQ
jgi:hypothetical protein